MTSQLQRIWDRIPKNSIIRCGWHAALSQEPEVEEEEDEEDEDKEEEAKFCSVGCDMWQVPPRDSIRLC